jgi:uncharacterized protein (DUF952 family)
VQAGRRAWSDFFISKEQFLIFHITSRRAWDEAQERGGYQAESLATERFIHCSTVSQVLPVAENFYKGQHGLVLLVVEPALLSSELKWEPPSGGTPPPGVPPGDLFPHIYGPINLDAVVNVVDLRPDVNGKFQIPNIS